MYVFLGCGAVVLGLFFFNLKRVIATGDSCWDVYKRFIMDLRECVLWSSLTVVCHTRSHSKKKKKKEDEG